MFVAFSQRMQSEEKAIIDYLKGWPTAFVSAKEIALKACGRKRFEDDQGWAIPFLVQMVRLGMIETDHLGHYRLVLEKKKPKKETHVSPQILKILKSSGKSFEGIEEVEEEEDSTPMKGVPPPYKPAAAPVTADAAPAVPTQTAGKVK